MSLQACFNQLSPLVTWSAADWASWNQRYPHRDGLNRRESFPGSRLKADPMWVMLNKNSLGSLAGWVQAGGIIDQSLFGGLHRWPLVLIDLDQNSPDAPWSLSSQTSSDFTRHWERPQPSTDPISMMMLGAARSSGDGSLNPTSYEDHAWGWRLRWTQALLSAGASPWAENNTDNVLHRLVRQQRMLFNSKVADFVLDLHPELLHAPDAHDLTPVMAAAASGRTASVRWLLERGAVVPENPWTPAACARWQDLMRRWAFHARQHEEIEAWFVLRRELAEQGLAPNPLREQEIAEVARMREQMRNRTAMPFDGTDGPSWAALSAAELKYGLREVLASPPEAPEAAPARRRLRL